MCKLLNGTQYHSDKCFQIAGRPQGSVENRTGGHDDTAKKGLQDVKDGFDKVGSKITSEDGEHVQESSNVNK